MTELTISNLPERESREEQEEILLSILSMIGEKSTILGLVVPIGKPRYVNGMVPNFLPCFEQIITTLFYLGNEFHESMSGMHIMVEYNNHTLFLLGCLHTRARSRGSGAT